MLGLQIQEVNLNNENEVREVIEYLSAFHLRFEKDIDYTILVKDNNKIIGTCSKSGSILKAFAVDSEYQGQGVSSYMVSFMLDEMFNKGIHHSFVFTKKDNREIFKSIGFKVLFEAEGVTLLEHGIYDINDYLNKIIKKYNLDTTVPKAALVMNCNPFTLGHKYLIEKASEENKEVLVFIVEEDKSSFPFEERINLVREGTGHLNNVKVIEGGEYIISSATFPSYFLREEDDKLKAYTEIDSGIFAEYFCKKLNIVRRYVGKEPYCSVTSAYNSALKHILSGGGIELIEIERLENKDGYISASNVRRLLKDNKLQEAYNMIPKATWEFLNSNKGKEIMENLKATDSPH
ncbi:[citrate (pro-3S)-lyase] ligase [Clostridium polynesiense]|uniref:[citrate (pro-3S)-lyase] ligase n=1 Tax=Clostridium polynesiense TaxID=1325933 RepID=UPI00058DE4F1|nr:[citrate (pro-3S)-lyase] ligase [Clostridium polynesiense]